VVVVLVFFILWTFFGGGEDGGNGMLGGLDMGTLDAVERARDDIDGKMAGRNAMKAEWEGILAGQKGALEAERAAREEGSEEDAE
ncbi:MAG: hypothetical protein AAF591_21430, partial [Verrucomicrobiota bacterium]